MGMKNLEGQSSEVQGAPKKKMQLLSQSIPKFAKKTIPSGK